MARLLRSSPFPNWLSASGLGTPSKEALPRGIDSLAEPLKVHSQAEPQERYYTRPWSFLSAIQSKPHDLSKLMNRVLVTSNKYYA
jgi:hypothetical protein